MEFDLENWTSYSCPINMDETNIVSYYKNEANEFILMKRKSVAIEDEILDLDAISLSNEDTW